MALTDTAVKRMSTVAPPAGSTARGHALSCVLHRQVLAHECTETLSRRIAEHIEQFEVNSVRRENTDAALCCSMQLSRPIPLERDAPHRAEYLASFKGSAAGQGLLNSFVK